LKGLNEGLFNQEQVESIKCRMKGSNIIIAIKCRSISIEDKLNCSNMGGINPMQVAMIECRTNQSITG
jgi:hypothetical protein